jgi:hypothetical protein
LLLVQNKHRRKLRIANGLPARQKVVLKLLRDPRFGYTVMHITGAIHQFYLNYEYNTKQCPPKSKEDAYSSRAVKAEQGKILKKSPLGFLYKAVKQKGHDNISYMT